MPGPGLFTRQTSLTEGTGPFTLVAPATGDQAFADVYTPGDGDDIAGVVVKDALGNWVSGTARLLGDGTLDIVTVDQSSNGGTVDFPAGAKTIIQGATPAGVAALLRQGTTTIGSNTFDVDLSATSKVDQRRAADGAVTFGVTGMASSVTVACYITNATGSDIPVSVVDDIAWDGGEAPPTTLGAGLTLTIAFTSLGTTSEAVQAAWMLGEVPA